MSPRQTLSLEQLLNIPTEMSCSLAFLFSIILSAWGLLFTPPEKTLEEKTIPRGQSYLEWSIANASYEGNPFDLEARAVFTHRGTGQTLTTPMFYGGEGTWKFRFTGTRAGMWTVATFSDDEELDGWAGTATVTPASGEGRQGFITSFGAKWGWAGSQEAFIPQYVMGKSPAAYLAEDGAVDTAMIAADIEEFVEEHGFTGFHIPVEGRWFDGENPDARVYRVVEELIRRAYAKGGASHIWLWGERDEGPEARAEGPLSKIDRRNLRYLAARLGPLPGWTMGYGVDTENGWVRPGQFEAWKQFLEARLGWDHFLGARVGYDEKGLWAVSPRPPRPPADAGNRSPVADRYTTWLGGDYIGYTSYRPLYPRYKAVLVHHSEKPSLEEDRFRLRSAEQWSYKDYWPELTRRGLWHSAMAGGVANIWGNLLPHSENDLGSRPYDNEAEGQIASRTFTVDLKDQIKTYARFFEDRFLKDMTTEYGGPELRLSSLDSTHYIIYREDADVVQLDVPRMKGPQPAVAVDAKKAYEEINIGPVAPGAHTWEAPYRSDWAVAVGAFGEKAGAAAR